MARDRKLSQPKDPRKKHPQLRSDLRRRVFALTDVCAICGKPLDTSLPPGSPLSPELDEIIPVARGGSPYDFDNLQAVHAICNRRKGSRMAGDDLPKNVNPTPTSKSW